MFQKAQRKNSKLRLSLCGPSGSGKTYSAIKIAMGIGGKIAIIDTEHGSAELFSHLTDYDVALLDPPFSLDRYIEYIKRAESCGYNILIIDSLSHAWSGTGGALEMVDKITRASKSGNSYTAWHDVTPLQNKLIETILSSDLHIIVTMRTKTAYSMENNEKGKVMPRKIGLAPIQRDGIDYEFTIVMDLSIDGHLASVSKDRTGLFDGKIEIPSEETGKTLLCWLNSGKTQEEIKEENEKKFNLALDSILFSNTLNELKIKFENAKNDYRNNTNLLNEIIQVKESRKIELLNNIGPLYYNVENNSKMS